MANVARQFIVDYKLFRSRINAPKGLHNQAPNTDQDAALKSYVSFQMYKGQPPSKSQFQQTANSISKAAGARHRVAKNWPGRFLQRNKAFSTQVRTPTLATEGKHTQIKEDFRAHLKEFKEARIKLRVGR